ncbi:TetR/AcrR family transcriptional regulator [Sphingomonas lenta]|uniref:TetR family transcriptional regulator n=1 Tax=Sphingomonas lenta TaxID=1141887 RepID=A0A2A2SI26_9SPHN|nr:TetR/AcrR family transcriptional regulator [Sphingomonas lenta]PAX08875.1 TetR family transcriptional regulator [Sphingomonas lenta]
MPGGRPCGFDKGEALDRALELFWRDGYEGTSIADVTEVMGVSRASLYAAFGDKEQLFRAVLSHYVAGPGSYFRQALERPRTVEAIRALLLEAAIAVTAPDCPPGCLVVHGALASGEEGAVARNLLTTERLSRQAAVRARLERGAGEGDLPAGTDVVLVTEYVMAMLHGIAVQASGGAGREALTAVAEIAIRGLALDAHATFTSENRGGRSVKSPRQRAKTPIQLGQIAMDF